MRFLQSKLNAGRLCIVVRFCSRAINPFHCSFILFGTLILFVSGAGAFPVGDAFDRGQAEFQASPDFHPRNEMPPVFHPSLHPNLNDEINEAHPIPKYIKKFSQNPLNDCFGPKSSGILFSLGVPFPVYSDKEI